jgi:hypothetical protein
MKTALIIGDIQRGITGAYPFARQVVPPHEVVSCARWLAD